MKFTREISKKLNKSGIFGMRIFKKYKLGCELWRLSKIADKTESFYDDFESLAFEFYLLTSKIDKCEYKSIFELNKAISELKKEQSEKQ